MDCVFCKIVNKKIDSRIVYEDDIVCSFMDISPSSMGHVLIIPKEHCEDYTKANDIIAYMFKIAEKIGTNIIDKLKQDGYTLVINYGSAQDVKHLHLHIIPNNHVKDYNLDEVYKKIKM